MIEFKKFEELDSNDLFSLSCYVNDIYDLITIDNEKDYMTFKNRLRHIIEIVECENEAQS